MRLKQLEFYNKALDWKLDKTEFSNLTLLVGISGVGKTQILRTIWDLKRIAGGASLNGIKWSVSFSATNNDEYIWMGEFENNPSFKEDFRFWKSEERETYLPKIISETFIRNNKTIIERTTSGIFLNGQETPKLSPYESVLSILNQEDDISPAYEGFKKIIASEFSSHKLSPTGLREFKKIQKAEPNFENIKESNLNSELKVVLMANFYPEKFSQIKERFIDVFPQVEDIKFDSEKDNNPNSYYDEYPLLQIKERGVKDWIPQKKISSGMYKTFMHISEMYLWPDGTVVLIDEFENSLGVNCLDVLTEDLLQENRRLQFIVTSHHPYIINNISPKYWKVVTRHGGVVTTHDASELDLGSSSHKAFMQLINHEQYREGIMA